jgi:hypothetical protein
VIGGPGPSTPVVVVVVVGAVVVVEGGGGGPGGGAIVVDVVVLDVVVLDVVVVVGPFPLPLPLPPLLSLVEAAAADTEIVSPDSAELFPFATEATARAGADHSISAIATTEHAAHTRSPIALDIGRESGFLRGWSRVCSRRR